jgi:DNA-binding CsgD family transcriptional regulator
VRLTSEGSLTESGFVQQRKSHGRRLTDRQAAILELVASGLSNKEIGFELSITEQAVKEQVSVLLQLLGAANRAALGRAAATRDFLGAFSIDPHWLRYLFQEAPIPIAVLAGSEHRFVAFNRAYEIAAEGRDLLGQRYVDVFPDAVTAHELIARSFASGERAVGSIIVQPLPAADRGVSGVAVFSRELAQQL